ncbi:hypothetical protein LJ707_12735 [Mucilaginibacter sp. UR6-1]|uniref:hypothetical protein n=1 Tax=Mucilaginibacter sp. UR6-1 TaxID=1435643 RepID=UPI001E64987C|nr:hypothetical protein [Mucilaginibacter sp. UR6-1]MCC8409798.1 hypothetical protein [Mucilaginibacter sp. UR6-1]
MKKITLWQRFIADTPAFFKRAQLFGAGLVTLAVSLSQIYGIPETLSTILSSIGATIVALSQFAIKQYGPFNQEVK